MIPTDALSAIWQYPGLRPLWPFLGNQICFHTFADCVSLRFKISLPLVHGSLPTAEQTLQQSAKYDIHHLQPVAEVLHQLVSYLIFADPPPQLLISLWGR